MCVYCIILFQSLFFYSFSFIVNDIISTDMFKYLYSNQNLVKGKKFKTIFKLKFYNK